MKVGIVTPRYYPDLGGVETYVKQVAERLVCQDFIVEIITTDPHNSFKKQEIVNGVKIKRFRSWAPQESFSFSNEMKNYLNTFSNKYDLIHAHQYHAFPAFYAAGAKKKNKLVFNPHYHGKGHTFFRNLLHKPYKFFGKKIFEKADRIVCVSKYEQSLLLNNFLVDLDKFVLIPGGIDVSEFSNMTKTKKNHRTILSVSRLEEYKGLQYLIEVMNLLDDDIILEIVGKGPYKKNLIELVAKLNLKDRVIFYQDLDRSELSQKYVDADLFVLLSKFEAYGITVAEALASNTPCIVANSAALKEWIDNQNCFGIDYPIDLVELKNLIFNVLSVTTVPISLFDWDEVTKKTIKLYSDLV